MATVSPDLYPFESQYLSIGGHRYHYIEAGTGDPVVMVHGNPSWSFYFRELMQRLSADHRCIAPDHIGMGYSDKPGDADYPYTLARRVEDLETFLEAKNIHHRITLILHDWGGPIGMSFARRHPKAIDKIVLLNTAAFHLPKSKSFPWVLRLTRTYFGTLAVRGLNAFSRGATYLGVKRRRLPADVRRAYSAPYNSWHNRIGTLRFVQDIPLAPSDRGYDYVTDLQSHLYLFEDTPVLIVWGMKDFIFDRHFLDKWLEYLPHAQVHRFEDCGHYILEDAPDEVGQLIADFVAD